MAQDSQNVRKSLHITPTASPDLSEAGDIGVDSNDSNRLRYNDGTGSQRVLLSNDMDDEISAREQGDAEEAATRASQDDLLTANLDDHIADTSTHGISVAIVGTTETQTLTNKTLTAPVINSPTGIVKADVGLGNVDNTSDATKNSATATLTNKTLTAPVINSPTGIVKADVGLGNVDNTSDANKPVSTAQAAADALKSNIASPTFTGTVTTPALNVSGLTATTVPYLNASKNLTSSAVTPTQLGYLDATSSIQTQLNAKQATGNYITSLTTDVVASGAGAAAATIQAGVVSNAKLATMPTVTIKGNNTGGTAAPLDLTVAQVNTMLGSLTNPMTTGGDVIYGGASGTPTRLANGSAGQFLKSAGGTAAPTWASFTVPTIQTFLSGSGNYTTPANVKYIRVRAVGGGGGGQGGGSTVPTGGAGGNTTFGGTVVVANGGTGGTNASIPAGGSASLGTGATGLAIQGGNGGGIFSATAGTNSCGGQGGASALGGGGGANAGLAGGAGANNSGAGGGGGSPTGALSSGSGGAAGGFVDAMITPTAGQVFAYVVGASGTAGVAGTSGLAGGAGGSGGIWVEEYYQ